MHGFIRAYTASIMGFLVPTLAWTLLAAAGIAWVYWLIVAWRVARALRAVPPVRAGLSAAAPPSGWPTVSIIVPAHNEERRIGPCVASLRAQRYESLEVVFVCDRCTDGTAALLQSHSREDPRIVVIENESCPDDWAGKCHAARLGAERVKGDWLLFVDADAQLDPDVLRAAIAVALERRLDLLSLLGRLGADHPFERIVQPVASRTLLRMYPLDQVNRPGSPRVFANGQFMLFRREAYDRIGGHSAVRGDLLEDIAFARLLRERGGRSGVVLAGDMLTVNMYDSLEQFRAGWRRIFIEACKRKPARLRRNGRGVMIGGVGVLLPQLAAVVTAFTLGVPVRSWLPSALLLAALGGWLTQMLVLLRIYRLAGAPSWAVLLYPVGAWEVGRLMLQAARDLEARRPVRWGGREYVLEPR